MINIAIDGPSGAGKSTIAKYLANLLGITYLDTGAMYRAVAVYALSKNVDPKDEENVVPLLKDITIKFVGDNQNKKILLNGEDVSDKIREHHISKCASDISKIPAVRLFLVEMQRKIASESNVVLDGRDITSYVLPNAKYKFYLTADASIRATRRYEELKSKGGTLTLEQVLADIKDRDYNDMNRSFAPLVQTNDSILIDSSKLTPQQVVEEIIKYIDEVKN